jgi:hypothetical protein
MTPPPSHAREGREETKNLDRKTSRERIER